ncbi:AraC-like DNA-binding protein [Saccharothrix tamanrassetensis]|uniref:AraC-like DNA-binding protein n=2 Tax=Saccharothrix tamanrassetensis TaxID=1051531 RepID=A0A841CNN3_9PSEU|nr:AraC-like DNA-binding protein [Saccharothrix tamanrassetensis]
MTTMVVLFGCTAPADGSEPVASPGSRVSGLRTRAVHVERSGHLHGIEVVLEPWAAFSLLGRSMDKLTNTVIPAEELLCDRLGGLAAKLGAAASWTERFGLLDVELSRWRSMRSCSHQVQTAWYLLVRTSGTIPIAELVSATGWSQRQLERRFREQIGLPPKAAARVLRFERALQLLVADRPAAEVAAACGYYDQAHLSREFTALAGRSISQFRQERASADDNATGTGATILSKTGSHGGD